MQIIRPLLISILIGCPSWAHNGRIDQTVDLIELNHYRSGAAHYSQTILYRFSPDYRRHDVMMYRMLDEETTAPFDAPFKAGGVYYAPMPFSAYYGAHFDGENSYVKSRKFRETWTDYDPETQQKKLFKEKFRIGLWPAGKK